MSDPVEGFPSPSDARERGIRIECVRPDPPVEEAELRTLVRRVAKHEDRPVRYVGLVLAGHETVTGLNREYLNHDFDTDVISFPLGEADERAVDGEIYVDLETAEERAPEFDSRPETEVRRYVVHGLLHLMGYDDQTREARERMRELEDRYLEGG